MKGGALMDVLGVGISLGALTGGGAGIAVSILLALSARRGWTRDKLLAAFTYLTAVVLALAVITSVLISRDLGFRWINWIAPASSVVLLVVLITERSRLRKRTD